MSALAGLWVFVKGYHDEFAGQGYKAVDLVDFVVTQVLLLQGPSAPAGLDGLIGFYEGRVAQLREMQRQLRASEIWPCTCGSGLAVDECARRWGKMVNGVHQGPSGK